MLGIEWWYRLCWGTPTCGEKRPRKSCFKKCHKTPPPPTFRKWTLPWNNLFFDGFIWNATWEIRFKKNYSSISSGSWEKWERKKKFFFCFFLQHELVVANRTESFLILSANKQTKEKHTHKKKKTEGKNERKQKEKGKEGAKCLSFFFFFEAKFPQTSLPSQRLLKWRSATFILGVFWLVRFACVAQSFIRTANNKHFEPSFPFCAKTERKFFSFFLSFLLFHSFPFFFLFLFLSLFPFLLSSSFISVSFLLFRFLFFFVFFLSPCHSLLNRSYSFISDYFSDSLFAFFFLFGDFHLEFSFCLTSLDNSQLVQNSKNLTRKFALNHHNFYETWFFKEKKNYRILSVKSITLQ